MKKKIIAYAFLPVLGISMLGMQPTAAMGMFGGLPTNITSDDVAKRQETMFDEEAAILGVSVADVKDAWANGKSYLELAQEKGISQDVIQARLKEAAASKMKEQLSALVAKGVITQAQADKRFEVVQSKVQKNKSGRGLRQALN